MVRAQHYGQTLVNTVNMRAPVLHRVFLVTASYTDPPKTSLISLNTNGCSREHKSTKQAMYVYLTLKGVRITILALENAVKCYLLRICINSLSYPAYKRMLRIAPSTVACLGSTVFFSHIIPTRGAIFE